MAGRTAVPVAHDPTLPPSRPWSFSASARRLNPAATKGEDALMIEPEEHRDAWAAYDQIGEVGQMVSASAGLLSQCRLYPGWVDPAGGEHRLRDLDGVPEEGFDEQFVADCESVLARFVDQGGSQRGLILSMAENFDVTGDSFLVGWPIDANGKPIETDADTEAPGKQPDERWEVVSRGALSKKAGRWRIQLSTYTVVDLPQSAIVYRMWRKHPRRPDDTRAWVLQSLDICRDLRVFTLAQRSAARSGIPAKILVTANEASPRNLNAEGSAAGGQVPSGQPSPWASSPWIGQQGPGPGQAPTDRLTWAQTLERLIGDAVMEVLNDAQSGRAVVPAVLAVTKDYVEKFNLLDLSRPIDAKLADLVEQARVRLGEAADCPPEMLRGLGEGNHWNGAQIADDEYRRYFRPKITAIADSWTVELLWGGLLALGYKEEQIRRVRLLVDAHGVVVEPDRAKDAIEVFKLGGIGWSALRRETGFDESDAASQEERDFILALLGKAKVGELAAPAALGEEPVGTEVDTVEAAAAAQQASAAPVEARRPVLDKLRTRTAASIPVRPTGAELAMQLAAVEQAARARLEEAAEVAFDQALQRGGAKLKTWARRDHDLRSLLAQVDSCDVVSTLGPARAQRVAEAQFAGDDTRRREDMFAAALVALLASFERIATSAYDKALRLIGAELSDDEIATNVAAGSSVLRESMLLLADREVFNPAETPTVGELSALRVPTPVTRRAMAAAGGANVEPGLGPLDDASSGLVFGPTLAPLEPQRLGWTWDYGSEPRQQPYEPHMDIDGEVFTGPDDPALDGIAPDGGPGFPGDHGGCSCDWFPDFADDSGDSGE